MRKLFVAAALALGIAGVQGPLSADCATNTSSTTKSSVSTETSATATAPSMPPSSDTTTETAATTESTVVNQQGSIVSVPQDNVTHVPGQMIPTKPAFSVLGWRGAPGFPAAAPVTSFNFGGRSISYSSPTFIMGGVLMVPLNETLAGMGATAPSFAPGQLQVIFNYNGNDILLNRESGTAHVGDQAWTLARPVVVRNDMVYVPASFFTQLDPRFSVSG